MEPPTIPLEYLSKQAYTDAMAKAYKKYWTQEIESNPIAHFRIDEDADIIEFYKSRSHGVGYTHVFITVTPKADVTFKSFQKKVEKSLTKKWIKSALYCYEWRDKNVGLHMHMLVELKAQKKLSEMHREFWSTFKTLLGDNKKNVMIIATNKPENVVNYLSGLKDGKRKKNYAQDILNRMQLGYDEPKKPISYHLERSAKVILPETLFLGPPPNDQNG